MLIKNSYVPWQPVSYICYRWGWENPFKINKQAQKWTIHISAHVILPRDETKKESALLKIQFFTSIQGRLEHETLGGNYESSVYRELAQFGSVQPKREKINNLKIETGWITSVWFYFCVNLIFLSSSLTHLFIKIEALEKLHQPVFVPLVLFFYITTKYSDTTLETSLLKQLKLLPFPPQPPPHPRPCFLDTL